MCPSAPQCSVGQTSDAFTPSSSTFRLPLELRAVWRCDATETDYRLEYAFRPDAFARVCRTSKPTLGAVTFQTTVNGGVHMAQPQAAFDSTTQIASWRIADVTDGERRSVTANWQLTNGPSTSAPTMAQFVVENCSLSAVDVEVLAGSSFQLAALHRYVQSGTYECEPMAQSQADTCTTSLSSSAHTQSVIETNFGP